MLCVQNLSVALRGRSVLRDITLTVPSGSLVAVIGPNGAGKTTLLRALSGDLAPSSGCITMAGRPLSGWSLQERAQRRAVLEQDYGLSFPLRCLDVVLLGRTMHQNHPQEQGGRKSDKRLDDLLIARAALDAVELCSRADDSYDILSGGQRQLVQLARVLAQIWEPPDDGGGQRCLLLDEPTSSLDLRYQHLVLSRAQRLAREGVAVLAVLHDINLAAQYADKLILLRDGAIAAQGHPGQVLAPATIGAAFGVSATRIDAAGHPVIVTTSASASSNPSHNEGLWPARYTRHVHISTEHPVRSSQAEGRAATAAHARHRANIRSL